MQKMGGGNQQQDAVNLSVTNKGQMQHTLAAVSNLRIKNKSALNKTELLDAATAQKQFLDQQMTELPNVPIQRSFYPPNLS